MPLGKIMSDERNELIANLLNAYIDNGDNVNAPIVAEKLLGRPLTDSELKRLVARLATIGRYDCAIETVQAHSASPEVCDSIVDEIVSKPNHHSTNLPIKDLLSLPLSVEMRESLMCYCQRRDNLNALLDDGDREYYKSLTDAERDELIMSKIHAFADSDKYRAANIALAGCSKKVLREVIASCIKYDMHDDCILSLVKALESSVMTNYIISKHVLNGEYEKALVASQTLRNGKKLTDDEYKECLAIAIEYGDSDQILLLMADASQETLRSTCELLLLRGRCQLASTIALMLDDIDLNDRCIQVCIEHDNQDSLDAALPLVQKSCSDTIRTNYFAALAATHILPNLELAFAQEHHGLSVTLTVHKSVHHWIAQGNWMIAYDIAKLDSAHFTFASNVKAILESIFSHASGESSDFNKPWSPAGFAFQVLIENAEIITPEQEWVDMLMAYAKTSGNCKMALQCTEWFRGKGASLSVEVIEELIGSVKTPREASNIA